MPALKNPRPSELPSESQHRQGFGMEVREYFIPDFSNWKVLADGQSLQTATRPPLNPPSPA
jgi:hypothetical protein